MADKMTTGRFLKKHTPQIPTWLGTTSKIVSDVIKDSKGIDIENIINKISTGFSLKTVFLYLMIWKEQVVMLMISWDILIIL